MAQTNTTPHFLRFAQALALVSGIAAPGCALEHGRDDAGPPPDGGTDVLLADAGSDAGSDTGPDTPDRCSVCMCPYGGDGDLPTCDSIGAFECCYLVGPLSPPDLPA